MIAFVIFVIIFGILIIVHEMGHMAAARKVGVRVEKFSVGFGRQLFKWKRDKTEYSISAIPLGGYVKLAGDSLEEYEGKNYEYLAQPPGKRFLILFCGPLLNYILGFLIFWLIFFVGYPALTTKIGGLIDGFGAGEAGLKPDDTVLAIDGQNVVYWEELQNAIQKKSEASEVILTILRDDQTQDIAVKIKEKEFKDLLGKKHSVGLLGVIPADEFITARYGLWHSFRLGIYKTLELTALTYRGLWGMITGQVSIRESVTGPLGIFFITSKAARLGIIALLHLVAVLSVSLAIFNLLPLPVLDGGHIFFLAMEKIRGRSLSLKTEHIITQIGLTIIISLALFVTLNDFIRYFGERVAGIFH